MRGTFFFLLPFFASTSLSPSAGGGKIYAKAGSDELSLCQISFSSFSDKESFSAGRAKSGGKNE